VGNDPMISTGTLAAKLEALIQEHYAGQGEKVPGTAAIAKEIRERTGLRISTGTLHKLRTGQSEVPTGPRLRALAAFFGRPMAFFLDREASNADMDLAVALRDKGVRAIALRSADLSEKSRKAILDMIDRAREIERIDPPASRHLDAPDDGG
jgi:transcriptional regulator with XRE-family HTH domain